MDDPLLVNNPSFGLVQDKLMTFTESKDDLTDKIDFVVCLGGDGTLLYASSLFQQSVPPIMAFHLGSLGFLTPFKFEDFRQQVPISSNYSFTINIAHLVHPTYPVQSVPSVQSVLSVQSVHLVYIFCSI